MSLAHGYAVRANTAPLEPFTFERRAVGANDIRIEVLYSGICHSDLHQARDDWGGSIYPMVPGHEIIGRVTEVGSEVTARSRDRDRVHVGDLGGRVERHTVHRPGGRRRVRHVDEPRIRLTR